MSILSTINALSPHESPSKNQRQKFYGNLTFRRPKPLDVMLSPLPTPTKNTICAELPSKEEEDSQFRASLYETSLRRLKKQRANELKEINIPTVNLEKHISNITRAKLYERESLIKLPKSIELPQSHTATSKVSKRHANYLSFIQEKHVETQKLISQYFPKEQSFRNSQQDKIVSLVNGTVFAFKNLKEKYLTLHQKSLDGKKCSEQLQRDNKSGMDSYSFSKSITDHVQKYKNRRQNERKSSQHEYSFFKPRLQNNNSVSLSKNQSIILKHDQKLPRLDNEEISSFIKKKQLNDPSQPQVKPEQIAKRSRRYRFDIKPPQNAEVYEEYVEDFTPWETELMIFD